MRKLDPRVTRVEPNPHSPYATAQADVRHLFPTPTWAKVAPRPGVLTPTGCGELAVVPEKPIEIKPGEPLPAGVCGGCAHARDRDTIGLPSGRITDCRKCGMATEHGALCALCRGELHDDWWRARAALKADAVDGQEESAPGCACSEFGPCPAHGGGSYV